MLSMPGLRATTVLSISPCQVSLQLQQNQQLFSVSGMGVSPAQDIAE